MRGEFVSYASYIVNDGVIAYDGPAETYTVPEDSGHVSYEMFGKLGRVVHIIVPDSIRDIRDFAFKTCYNLVTVDLPAEVDHFGVSVFQMCRNLVRVDLPQGVRAIDSGMFVCCDSLKCVSIPSSVERVDQNAFIASKSLREIYIDPDRIYILPPDQRVTAAITYMNSVAGSGGENAVAHKAHKANAVEADVNVDTINGYISDNSLLILETAIDRNEKAAVSYMIGHDLVGDECVADMLAKANKLHRTEISAMLLERNRSLLSSDKKDQFDWDPFEF